VSVEGIGVQALEKANQRTKEALDGVQDYQFQTEEEPEDSMLHCKVFEI